MKNVMINIIILILLVLIVCFGVGIYNEFKSNQENNEIKNSLSSSVQIKESPNINIGANGIKDFDKNSGPTIFNPTETSDKFIYADFDSLFEKNSDTVGWIWMPDTDINYPIVRANDNDFYLKNNFEKTPNPAGWIYADYRSNFDIDETNTVIYGHNRNDNSMFGQIPKIDEKWLEIPEHKYVYFSTPVDTRVYEIVSVYTIESNPYYIGHNFNNQEFEEYLSYISEKNQISKISQKLAITDNILTLSTCKNTYSRYVIHAKLVQSKEVS